MAALDFPASPTVGQVFVGGNGVTYTWNGTLWLASGASAGGDFYAVEGAGTLTTTATTLIPTQVQGGNSGGWYSTSTGRYSPPAGRYAISALLDATSGSFPIVVMYLRKNGVVLQQVNSGIPSANNYTELHVSTVVDANGSDWFDIQALVNAGTGSIVLATFQAFPISGIKGPPGDPYPGTVGGDFMASHSGLGGVLGGAAATIVWNTVQLGNANGEYSVSTGRYTPPAGRYCLFTEISGTLNASGTILQLAIRKNGVAIGNDVLDQGPAGSQWANPCAQVLVDANGSDWFDVTGLASAGVSNCSGRFLAYPISGIKGPPGDIGAVTGVIVDFAGSTAPAGWLLCQGQSVTVAAYPALHAAIGYQFGGSGLNFNVPDLGGRVTAGKEATATRLTTAGAGIDGATLGAAGGTQTHVLTVAQLASHSHDIYVIGATSGLSGGSNFNLSATTTSGAAGGNAAHQNTQPTMIINKIIKT